MDLVLLTLIWLGIGLLIGLLALVAKLRLVGWHWLHLPVVGAIIAVCGGWLGLLCLGRYFATGVALWVSIAGVVLIPHGVVWVRARLYEPRPGL